MGWYSDSIGLGSGQQHWLGQGDRRRSCDKFNGHDYDDEDWVCQWLGHSHGDVASHHEHGDGGLSGERR